MTHLWEHGTKREKLSHADETLNFSSFSKEKSALDEKRFTKHDVGH
jgi:hypothetical protein